MKQELQNQLFEKYPQLFANKDKSPRESLMCFGIEVGNGWYEILSNLCWMIKQHEDNISSRKEYLSKNNPEKLVLAQEYFSVKFDQIKEKYGGLRIYFSGGDNYVDGLVNMAEAISYHICEICGDKGEANKVGWISVRCETHRNF